MNFEKLRRLTYTVVFILGITALGYLFMKRVFIYIMPFLIGWFVAFVMRPPAAYLSPKLKIKQNILRLILTVIAILVCVGLSALAIWALSREAWGLITRLGEGEGRLNEIISGLIGEDGFIGKLFGRFSSYVAEGIYSLVMSLLSTLGGVISSLASMVPRVLLFILITVIASIYFALDLENINAAVKRLLPTGVCELIVRIKDGFLVALLRYIRSYLLLLVITFGEMLVGLFILRAPYPLMLAILIAVLDLLPVIGVGTVLIPWSVWSFVTGESALGIGLAALFLLHTVLRQIIEPKIVGKNLGIHPVLTLVFLYVGYSLFGFVGLILVPILTVLVNIAFGKDNAAEVSKGTAGEGD